MPSASGVSGVSELADRLAAVERPVVPKDFDRAAREQRCAAEQRHAELLGGAEQIRDRKRNARRRPASGELLHDLEDAALRRVLAAERVASAYASAFERLAVSRRDIVDVGVRPALLRADEPGQLVFQMIRDQPSDQVALGERAGTVHDARVHAHQRAAVADRLVGEHDRRPLSCADSRWRGAAPSCRAAAARRTTRCRARAAVRSVEAAASTLRRPPTLTSSKSSRPAPPDADERGGMRNGVAAARGALDCRAIADVAVDGRAGKAAAAGVAREDHQVVPSRGQRPARRRGRDTRCRPSPALSWSPVFASTRAGRRASARSESPASSRARRAAGSGRRAAAVCRSGDSGPDPP